MTFDCLVASPPYAGNANHDYSLAEDGKTHARDERRGYRQGRGCFRASENYGDSEGQLGRMESGEFPMTATTTVDVPTVTWEGCYDSSYKGIITPESYSHPAKMSRGLLCRILDFMLEQGWVKRGDLVCDPFCGVGTTGIECASRGLRFYGVELEPRFARYAAGYDCPGMNKVQWVRFYGRWGKMAEVCPDCQKGPKYVPNSGIIPSTEPHRFRGNFDLHRRRWEQFGDPIPVCLCGDSRRLGELLGKAGAIVGSPPWQENLSLDRPPAAERRKLARERGINNAEYISPVEMEKIGKRHEGDYGTSAGQLGSLPAGSIDSVVGSPPFSGTEQPCASQTRAMKDYHAFTRGQGTKRDKTLTEGTEGQLGSMAAGSVDSVISSPPYASGVVHDGNGIDQTQLTGNKPGPNTQAKAEGYGSTAGQLGSASGDTFWSAAAQIVRECWKVLRSGSYAAWVVKDFCKSGRRVEFGKDWLKLLCACGFEPVLIVEASLVKVQREPGLFGGDIVQKRERKSFFRRLHEKKLAEDDPCRIDEEIVLFVQRKP